MKAGERPVGPHSFGGGMTYKKEDAATGTTGSVSVVEKVKEKVLGA